MLLPLLCLLSRSLFGLSLLVLSLSLLLGLPLLLLPRIIAALNLLATLLSKIAVVPTLLRLRGDRLRRSPPLFRLGLRLLLGLSLLTPLGLLLLPLIASLLTLLLGLFALFVPTALRLGVRAQADNRNACNTERESPTL